MRYKWRLKVMVGWWLAEVNNSATGDSSRRVEEDYEVLLCRRKFDFTGVLAARVLWVCLREYCEGNVEDIWEGVF
ncbi:hypothetical protein I3760_13G056800 [Carya illinoinensis]|nr:hypothetical protein I3760_13G056800 [Carya illinoinensis]